MLNFSHMGPVFAEDSSLSLPAVIGRARQKPTLAAVV